MKKILIAASLFCIAIAACKKDPDNNGGNPSTGSRSDTLTTGKWVITAIIAEGKNPITQRDTTVNFFASNFDSCAKDDLYLFMTTGKMSVDQGTARCDMSGPQQKEDGTWSLSTTKDTLIMADGTLPGRFKIISFSNTSMQLMADTVYAGVLPVKLTATFTHQ
jgi:hypothetical protein